MSIGNKLRSLRHSVITIRTFLKEYRQWQRMTSRITVCQSQANRLVIIPCDPYSVGGSRGDEAMMMAVMQYYCEKYAQIPITIVSGTEEGDCYIRHIPVAGVKSLKVWTGSYPLERIYKAVMEQKPTFVVLLGADCMDGFYSPFTSLTLLALHDLFSRTPGVESRLMGFSFNVKPYWLMCKAFRGIHKDTVLCLRDPVSLERFKKKTKMGAGLVADSAFMLRPDFGFQGFSELQAWVKERRQAGIAHVIGMNFHPMLRKYENTEEIREDALILALNMEKIMKRNLALAFVLIPHDDRSRLTDNLMLSTMAEYLREKGLENRIYYREEVYRAFQLKGLCQLLDGLVSSRMHLAIAALGMEIPVMAATYQGKFEGLFRHFLLDESFLLRPGQFLSADMMSRFEHFLEELPSIKSQIKRRLPYVLDLSYDNLKDE